MISVYKLFWTDKLFPKELVRVPLIIGPRTVLVGKSVSLGGLYESTIY